MNIKWSRVVLTVFLLNSFTSSESLGTNEETINNEQLQLFSNLFKKLNAYFDNEILHDHKATGEKQINATDMKTEEQLPVEENINVERRSNAHTPWYCHSTVGWKDLGNLHYPRFVKEIRCTGNSCMHGFYNCSPRFYPLRVLSAREDSSSRESQDVDASFLPPGLRQNWTLMEIDISVGCMCGN